MEVSHGDRLDNLTVEHEIEGRVRVGRVCLAHPFDFLRGDRDRQLGFDVGADVGRLADVGVTRRCRRVEPLGFAVTVTAYSPVWVFGDFDQTAVLVRPFIRRNSLHEATWLDVVYFEVPILEQLCAAQMFDFDLDGFPRLDVQAKQLDELELVTVESGLTITDKDAGIAEKCGRVRVDLGLEGVEQRLGRGGGSGYRRPRRRRELLGRWGLHPWWHPRSECRP